MSGPYSAIVESTVRCIGNAFNTGTIFETGDVVAAVRDAALHGLVNIEPGKITPFRMRENGQIFGIELTAEGLRFLGINPEHYCRK